MVSGPGKSTGHPGLSRDWEPQHHVTHLPAAEEEGLAPGL